jgi:sec-independent protein translocase protein TatA
MCISRLVKPALGYFILLVFVTFLAANQGEITCFNRINVVNLTRTVILSKARIQEGVVIDSRLRGNDTHISINREVNVGIGQGELLIIIAVVLLLFGGKKIPELMKGLGKGMHEFKKGLKGEDEEVNRPSEQNKLDPPKP